MNTFFQVEANSVQIRCQCFYSVVMVNCTSVVHLPGPKTNKNTPRVDSQSIALAERIEQVKNSFEKYFFKLMDNSVFGKIMDNLGKRVDVKRVTDQSINQKTLFYFEFVDSKIANISEENKSIK